MSQTERKLEVLVDGNLVGVIRMKINRHTIIVDGDNILLNGAYSMTYGDIGAMAYRRARQNNPGQIIRIKSY